MTVYNKLKIAILTILATQTIHAITLEPLQVMSAPGDLLYAEMNFSQADISSNLQVSLATPEDLMDLGIASQPSAQLNFFARRNGQGTGVIVITSSRPFTQPELDIVLKIQEGHGTRLQHIKQSINRKAVPALQTANEKPLTPKFIVSEKDIALNLPESTQYNVASTSQSVNTIQSTSNSTTEPSLNRSQVLAINTTPPPTLQTNTTTTAATETNIQQSTDRATPPSHSNMKETVKPSDELAAIAPSNHAQTVVSSAQVAKQSPEKTAKEQVKSASPTKVPEPNIEKIKTKNQTAKVKEKTASETRTSGENQHVVQRNESLWSIANRIATQTNQPIAQVMQQIKAQNSHAFIQGDVNRLRQGVALNLSAAVDQSPQKTATVKTAPSSTQASGRAKYRLNQAEMNLVADNEQDSTQVSAKHSTKQDKSTAELSLKVMTAREKTVKLQQSVTEMELALRQKDQRIQLLNARLAQLQQQLKERENAKKSVR
ncbi:hypothetical protein N5J44_00645 [Acinetobacter ursingii]|uniref:FimV N-terminal domain-containing protein n=1 Tax=Acinetobacter ursingii TaxID=108980 RepID=A0AA46S6K0_9GAMM|nr:MULTISPECIES: hypothetical protein [Acinetobacter]EXD35902.1 hypothetical protein J500_1679 [Acinetobacter sp. 479375]MCU4496257.1 hypothetical protein [Acinetobacter ursingii]MDG9947848.1 hypothetical protein [Acinetobacter ursingii]MDH2017772.1 hypothetical protein [Acinetobacter ursingii]MDH2070067.1 hypothetical protein [Acinetobacter ursingii]